MHLLNEACKSASHMLMRSQSHTILGTKSQRGLVQMTLDVIFQACDEQLVQSLYGAPAYSSLANADVSEAQMYTATAYIENMYGDNNQSGRYSRAQTPVAVSPTPFDTGECRT
jgi:succinate--hydroxymethylglutarate CoA-transferase